MSLSITINNINDLTDMERAVLRVITGESAAFAPSVADTLKQTVREMAAQPIGDEPVEPEEVYSPHTTVADAPPAPPAPASAERDSAGLPWDKRIHASTRAKVADGTWRYMRGVDKALVEQVEAELRAVQAIPAPVAAANVELPAPVGWPTASSEPAAPAAPAAPIVPLPPVPLLLNHDPAQKLPMTFAQLMQHITPLLVSGELTQPKLQGVVESLGIPHLAYLGGRPDLIDTVKAAIDEAVGGAQ